MARGTSDHASRYAKYLLGAINGIIVTLATPSLFTIYKRPPQFDNVLVLGISQSGKSPDIVAALAEAQRQGAEIIAISDDSKMLELAHNPLTPPATVPEWASSMTTIIPGQLLTMHLADVRNYDVDQPRNIHKVTETL